jgi:hypothetical protein
LCRANCIVKGSSQFSEWCRITNVNGGESFKKWLIGWIKIRRLTLRSFFCNSHIHFHILMMRSPTLHLLFHFHTRSQSNRWTKFKLNCISSQTFISIASRYAVVLREEKSKLLQYRQGMVFRKNLRRFQIMIRCFSQMDVAHTDSKAKKLFF